jgi:hypothetical protein
MNFQKEIEEYIIINPGENLITKNLTCYGIALANRHKFESSPGKVYINLTLNNEALAENFFAYFLAGSIPFPCEFQIPQGSVITYTPINFDERHPLILSCKKGLFGEGKGYLKGFKIFPEQPGNIGYATLKPFPGEKMKILCWSFFLAIDDTQTPQLVPYETEWPPNFGKIDIYNDEIPIAEKVSLEQVFSLRNFYKLQNIEFKKLLYFRCEGTPYERSYMFPYVAAFIKRLPAL